LVGNLFEKDFQDTAEMLSKVYVRNHIIMMDTRGEANVLEMMGENNQNEKVIDQELDYLNVLLCIQMLNCNIILYGIFPQNT
jgi:hypothetical protein